MKLLITGGKGMLGRTLQNEFRDWELVVADLPEADITAAGFDAFLAANKPDAVIHCAAMIAVDKCETEIEFAYKLNAFGTANVAAGTSVVDFKLTRAYDDGQGAQAEYASYKFPAGSIRVRVTADKQITVKQGASSTVEIPFLYQSANGYTGKAVMNGVTGERDKMIPKESRAMLKGEYGKLPGTVKEAVRAKAGI